MGLVCVLRTWLVGCASGVRLTDWRMHRGVQRTRTDRRSLQPPRFRYRYWLAGCVHTGWALSFTLPGRAPVYRGQYRKYRGWNCHCSWVSSVDNCSEYNTWERKGGKGSGVVIDYREEGVYGLRWKCVWPEFKDAWLTDWLWSSSLTCVTSIILIRRSFRWIVKPYLTLTFKQVDF